MAFKDSMILGAGHCMMVSNIPENVGVQLLSDKYFENLDIPKTAESFGLFGGSINYNTFYPEVTAKDFNPEQDDFIEPVYRLLSACVVAKGYNPTDFSKPGVLKNSMGLLLGQTVNCDHETDIGNAIGAVSQVSWQEGYTDKATGTKIPAGINGVLKIDAKSNPRIARGINMDPPSIHSNSVTVQFEWEPSHKFKDIWEFYSKLGTYDDKGELIRRIVTKIISYKETSLVSHGADPFAQIIKDGKIINPAYANSQYNSFSEDKQKDLAKELSKQLAFMDFKEICKEDTMHNTGESFIEGLQNSNQHNKEKNNMNELEKFLEGLFGEGMLSLEEGAKPTPEIVQTKLKELIQSKTGLETQLTDMTKKRDDLNTEVINLKAEKKVLEKTAEIGTSYLADVRNQTMASYKKLVGEDKVDDNIVSLINAETTGLETLKALDKTYVTQLEDKFPMKCSACGSKDISRASSIAEGEEDETKNKDTRSPQDILADIQAAKFKA